MGGSVCRASLGIILLSLTPLASARPHYNDKKKQDSSHAAIPLYHPRARVCGWGYRVTMDGGCFWRKTLVSMDATSELTQQDLTGTLQTMHLGAYKFFLVERFFF